MIRVIIVGLLFLFGCSKDTSSGSSGTLGSVVSGPNVVAISMGCGYINEPCVSVTICTPGTTTCQTIDNVLLDTGSYGLRLFSQVVTVGLGQEVDGSSRSIAECTTYGDGSSQWGPVKIADVQLGSNKASSVPIQIVNSSFSSPPANCTDMDTSPTDDGYNGILGVGLLVQDCGSNCVSSSSNNVYYACSGSTCTGTALALTSQVTNPVAMLSSDNNGVAVVLPTVPGDGYSGNVIGSLILGIGTETNNTPSGVTTFTASNTAEFTTTYGGHTYPAFIDSGSNAYYFPSSSISYCDQNGQYANFYCPGGDVSGTAVQVNTGNSVQGTVGFTVGNAGSIFAANYTTTATLSGIISGYFDWGLPFFLGRTVYVGIKGKTSTLGTGPYWAY